MSVKAALYEYLTDRRELTGLPAQPFERSRLVGGVTITCRNDARRWLRDKIGDAVYAQRRPRGAGHTSITLRTAGETVEHGIDGAAEGTQELLTVTVFARGGDAAARAETVASLVRLAIDGYHHDTWGSVAIGEAVLDSRATRENPPPDGSDDWEFEIDLDFSVLYVDESSPVYATDRLTAYVTFVDGANQGDTLRLSLADSLIPVGRELVTVTWVVRTGSIDGTIAETITGAPDAALGLPYGSGTKGAPALSRSHYGLTGVDIFVSLTITDDAGSVSSAEGFQDGS